VRDFYSGAIDEQAIIPRTKAILKYFLLELLPYGTTYVSLQLFSLTVSKVYELSSSNLCLFSLFSPLSVFSKLTSSK